MSNGGGTSAARSRVRDPLIYDSRARSPSAQIYSAVDEANAAALVIAAQQPPTPPLPPPMPPMPYAPPMPLPVVAPPLAQPSKLPPEVQAAVAAAYHTAGHAGTVDGGAFTGPAQAAAAAAVYAAHHGVGQFAAAHHQSRAAIAPTYRTDQLRASSELGINQRDVFWSEQETGPWTLAGNGQDGAQKAAALVGGTERGLYRALGKLTNAETGVKGPAPFKGRDHAGPRLFFVQISSR